MTPAERDAFISEQLETLIARVKNGEAPAKDRLKNERKVLERLIPIETDGFRGVTLTAIMGKMVRSDVNTSNEFGSINPRAVFEKGIRPVLKKHRVPTGASAPLNVAKNAQVLDEKWAEGRKPEDAALAAVNYIRLINRHWENADLRDDLILIYIERLLEYAQEVAQLDTDLENLEQETPLRTGGRLAKFAMQFQEGGAFPQVLFGILLEELRAVDTSFREVRGAEASAFGTNTTSNKPADVWEVLLNGEYSNLYEVTCKPVDLVRIEAAFGSFSRLGLSNAPITFICRMPHDASSLELDDGQYVYRGLTFQFLDFATTITTLFLLLAPTGRQSALNRISLFVADPSRTRRMKAAWKSTFGVA